MSPMLKYLMAILCLLVSSKVLGRSPLCDKILGKNIVNDAMRNHLKKICPKTTPTPITTTATTPITTTATTPATTTATTPVTRQTKKTIMPNTEVPRKPTTTMTSPATKALSKTPPTVTKKLLKSTRAPVVTKKGTSIPNAPATELNSKTIVISTRSSERGNSKQDKITQPTSSPGSSDSTTIISYSWLVSILCIYVIRMLNIP